MVVLQKKTLLVNSIGSEKEKDGKLPEKRKRKQDI